MYLCWLPEYDEAPEDGKEITHLEAEYAASEYCEECDVGDYAIAGNGPTIVMTRDEYGIDRKIRVWAEQVTVYHASEIEESESEEHS